MANMTEREFAAKVVADKVFRSEVVANACGVELPDDVENGMGMFLETGASKMGYSLDVDALDAAIKGELDKLGFFKKMGFVGSLINAARKAAKQGK